MNTYDKWTFTVTANSAFLRALYTLLKQCEAEGEPDESEGNKWFAICCDPYTAAPEIECDHPCDISGGEWKGGVFMIDMDERWDE
jgi:hypothetical protein